MKSNSPKRPEFCLCCVVDNKSACTTARIMISYSPPSWFSWALQQETNAVSNTRFSSRSWHKPNKTKNLPSARSPSPSMLHPPPFFPANKRGIHTENRLPSPRTPPASLPRIKGSKQCSNTGCIPPWVVVVGVVVGAAAAAAAAAATMSGLLVAAVADLQKKHGTGIKGVGGRPPLAADFTSGPSCWRELFSRPRRRRNRGNSTAGRRCCLRFRVRWYRSSGWLAPPDCPPNWCDRGNSTADRRFHRRNFFRRCCYSWRDAGAPPTDVAEGTVPPVAGAAAGTTADAAPADDAGASAKPFDDAAGKTRVPVTASAAGAAAASATTTVGADCCGPSDRENIGIFISSDWNHSSNAESEITAVGGERLPLGGYSCRWWRACKGSSPLANDAVASGGPDTSKTGPPWQSTSVKVRCCSSDFGGPNTSERGLPW